MFTPLPHVQSVSKVGGSEYEGSQQKSVSIVGAEGEDVVVEFEGLTRRAGIEVTGDGDVLADRGREEQTS